MIRDVFISYSRKQDVLARHLKESLEEEGLDVWFDERSIPYGEDFIQEIEAGIDASVAVAFLASRDSVISRYCRLELNLALKKDRKVIVLMVEDDAFEDRTPGGRDGIDLPESIPRINGIPFQETWRAYASEVSRRPDSGELPDRLFSDMLDRDPEARRNFKESTRNVIRVLNGIPAHERSFAYYDWSAGRWNHARSWRERWSELLFFGKRKEAQTWLADADSKAWKPVPNELQRKYIRASGVFARNVKLSLAALLVIATSLIWSFWSGATASQQLALVNDLIGEAQSSDGGKGLQLKTLLAVEATRRAQSLTESAFSPVETASSSLQAQRVLRSNLLLVGARPTELGSGARYRDVAIGPDTGWIAAAPGKGGVEIWDPDRIEQDVVLMPDEVVTAMVSDGERLAISRSLGRQGITSILSASDPGRAIEEDLEHEGPVQSIALGPGNAVAVAVAGSGVEFWPDLKASREPLRIHEGFEVTHVALSPDREHIAIVEQTSTPAGVRGYRLKVFDWNADLLRILPDADSIFEKRINGVAFGLGGRRLVFSYGSTVQPYALPGFDRLEPLTIPANRNETSVRGPDGQSAGSIRTGLVHSIAISPDGSLLATGSGGPSSGEARIWQVHDLSERLTYSHETAVKQVVFGPAGTLLATVANPQAGLPVQQQPVRVWDLRGTKVQIRIDEDFPVRSLAVSPDGRFLALTDDHSTYLRSGDNFESLEKLPFDAPICLAFDPFGGRLAIGTSTGLKLWSLPTGEELEHPDLPSRVEAVAFGNEGRVAAALTDRTLLIWSGSDFASHQELKLRDIGKSLSFNPDETRLTVFSETDGLALWTLETSGEWVEGETSPLSASRLAFHPHESLVAAGGIDSKVRLVSSDRAEQRVLDHASYAQGQVLRLRSIAFDQEGILLATAAGNEVLVWDTQQGRPLATIVHEWPVGDVAFVPGREQPRLAFASRKTVIISLWRPEDLVQEACRLIDSNLTRKEWSDHLRAVGYRKTCADQAEGRSPGRPGW